MKILVFMKQIPDTASPISVSNNQVDASKIDKYAASPYDEYALEQALQIKDKDASKEALEAKAESLGKAAQKLGEVMYAESQKAQATQQGAQAAGSSEAKKDEKVVDAEYTEVDDKK